MIETFANLDTLADAAAAALADALAGPAPKTLIATGGGTPGPVYDRLARWPLDWAAIQVAPSDDRWVASDAEESNERLVRSRLLVGAAAAAGFTPLVGYCAAPEDDARAAEARLADLPPCAAVLLGMGSDGHIASLFPGDPDLTARLDPRGERRCVSVAMSGQKPFLPRVSLTVRALLETRLIILLLTGEAKRAQVQRVLDDPTYSPPVAAILRQARTPVRILWASA